MEHVIQETDFIKGFNDGYIVTKHLPDLSEKLAAIESDAPRIDGFKEGRKQFVIDKAKDMREHWKNEDKGHSRPPNKSKDKDIDRD